MGNNGKFADRHPPLKPAPRPQLEGAYVPLPPRDATRNLEGTGKLLQFRQNARPSNRSDYANLDPKKLLDAIAHATREGAAIMLGLTQDGGAYSILILDGNDKAREYPHTVEEAHDVLDSIIATYS